MPDLYSTLYSSLDEMQDFFASFCYLRYFDWNIKTWVLVLPWRLALVRAMGKGKIFLKSNTSWDKRNTKETWANSVALVIAIPIWTFADKTDGQLIVTGIFPTYWHSHFAFLQMAVDQAHRQNLSSLFLPVFESVNPCLILMVRRDNIVGDAVEVLRKTKNVDYKKPLKVSQVHTAHSNWECFWTNLALQPVCSSVLTELCVSGYICRGGSCWCWRCSQRIFFAHHEGVARSQIWNVQVLWGVQADLVLW